LKRTYYYQQRYYQSHSPSSRSLAFLVQDILEKPLYEHALRDASSERWRKRILRVYNQGA
jgi:hypothetical protein